MSSESKVRNSTLPFVLVNMAMTADGKIATANRNWSSFGSDRDREHMLELRATADAVMCGARTVNAGRVVLGPGAAKYRQRRLRGGLAEYNLRIIVSGSGAVDPRAEIFRHRFSPIIVLTSGRASAARLRGLRAVADEVEVCGTDEINFPAALRWLRAKWKVRRLLCEGGGELNGALFRAGLVDELHLTIGGVILGGDGAPTIADGRGFRRLAGAALFKLRSFKLIGYEGFAVFRRMPWR